MEPVRVAFCPILFEANGGQLSRAGLPIFEDGIRGRCNRAYDCGQCNLLQARFPTQVVGNTIGWECVFCLRETRTTPRTIPGYFQSGRGQLPAEDPNHDPDQPPLSGCTRCGSSSSFLQLVIRSHDG